MTSNELIREALVASIEKWKRKTVGEDVFDTGPESCPLCQLFFNSGCYNCPVSVETELDCCDGSPYYDYSKFVGFRRYNADDQPEFYEDAKRLAQAEVNFLEMLLEKHDERNEDADMG